MAVDMVILARAWFSDSEMNLSFVPGLSFSNSDDNFWASAICELETKAIVTSLSDAPRLPAPAQPEVSNSPTAATPTHSWCSTLRVLFTFASLFIESITNVHNRCHTPTALPAHPAEHPAWPGTWLVRWRSEGSSGSREWRRGARNPRAAQAHGRRPPGRRQRIPRRSRPPLRGRGVLRASCRR